MKNTLDMLKESLETGKHLQIKLLGDSITHGVGGSGFEQNGELIVAGWARNPQGFCWAKLLKEYMQEKYSCSVINNACTGTNIEFMLRNFDTLVDENDDFIICTIGTNNRHQFFHEGEKKSREQIGTEFYENVLKLNGEFEKRGKKVIFMANIPASVANEQDGADFWRILHMDDITTIYKRAQEKAGFALISLYDFFGEYCSQNGVALDSLLRDGLHPNDEGYRVMFEILKKVFEI